VNAAAIRDIIDPRLKFRIVFSVMADVKSGIGGWLRVLCLVLLWWQPLSFALVAAGQLDAVGLSGVPAVLVLVGRLLFVGLGIAAGLALLSRRPAAVALAKASLAASAGMDTFVYTTSYFPSNRAPGEGPIWAAASILWYGGWFVYLVRSRRVRETFQTHADFGNV
jgi:hypothetical protein